MASNTVRADDRPHIHRALARLRESTSLPLTFGGAVDADRQVMLTEFAGSTVGALRGVSLAYGHGLGGKVVALRRPLVVNDYVQTPSISHRYDRIITAEGLRAMVAAPIVVRGNVRGVLYGAIRDATPLGDRIVSSVVESAREVEQSLVVQDELARRVQSLHEHTAEPGREAASPQWEQVREAYTELRILAQQISDESVRERFEMVCRKLSSATSPPPQVGPRLTEREIDVLSCVALGWTNSEIASELGLGFETVKSYLRSSTQKLEAHSRLEAVVAARRHGLLP